MKTGIVQRLLALPFSARQRTLAKSRPAMSYSDFVASITRSGGNADAAGLVYSKLQDWVYHDGFTPYPDDSLSSVFGIAEEELDEDIILDALVRDQRPEPDDHCRQHRTHLACLGQVWLVQRDVNKETNIGTE